MKEKKKKKNKMYDQQRKNLLFLVGIVCWGLISIIPIQINIESTTCQLIYTIMAIPPLIFTILKLKTVTTAIYDTDKDNDENLDIFSFCCIVISWSISWSLIHMIFWVWDDTSFGHIPSDISGYTAWRYFIGGTFMMTVGGPPPYFLDPTDNSWASLLMGIHSKTSLFVLLVVGTILFSIYREKKDKEAQFLKQQQQQQEIQFFQQQQQQQGVQYFQQQQPNYFLNNGLDVKPIPFN